MNSALMLTFFLHDASNKNDRHLTKSIINAERHSVFVGERKSKGLHDKKRRLMQFNTFNVKGNSQCTQEKCHEWCKQKEKNTMAHECLLQLTLSKHNAKFMLDFKKVH